MSEYALFRDYAATVAPQSKNGFGDLFASVKISQTSSGTIASGVFKSVHRINGHIEL
jgi:hypothetical protein